MIDELIDQHPEMFFGDLAEARAEMVSPWRQWRSEIGLPA